MTPSRAISLGPFSPSGLYGYKPQWFSKTGDLGAHLFGTGPENWGICGGALTPHSSRRSSIFVRSLPIMGHCSRVRLLVRLHLCLSYHFDVAPIACCEGGIQLILRSFSEEIIPYVALHLVCLWEERSSGSFYVSILDTPSFCTFQIKCI